MSPTLPNKPTLSNKNVRVVVYERDSDMRQSMKAALNQDAFTKTLMTAGLKTAQAAIFNDEADLAVVDIDQEGDELRGLMRRIRHHEVGDNPFPVTVALTATSNYETIRRTIDSGFDIVLLKPVAMTTFLDRVRHLMRHRAAFAVTSDYIGPDRRAKAREARGRPGAHLMIVPNPMKIMATGDMSPSQMRNFIKDATVEVNERRVVCNGDAINGIIGDLAAKFMYGEVDHEFVHDLKKIQTICDDMDRRLAHSSYAHVAELCTTTETLVARILERPMAPEARDMELLQKMGSAIERAFKGDEHDILAAHTISDSVRAVA